jgi:hypothetical protein
VVLLELSQKMHEPCHASAIVHAKPIDRANYERNVERVLMQSFFFVGRQVNFVRQPRELDGEASDASEQLILGHSRPPQKSGIR